MKSRINTSRSNRYRLYQTGLTGLDLSKLYKKNNQILNDAKALSSTARIRVKNIIRSASGYLYKTGLIGILLLSLLITNCVPSAGLENLQNTPENKSIGKVSNSTNFSNDIDGKIRISEKDDMPMVFVPEGKFEMGSEDGNANEKPIHTVFLDGYWIDQTEVTNRMYRICVADGECSRPKSTEYFYKDEYLDFPVVFIEWDQANEYCEWAGRRLPTEAEWEKAAHGTMNLTYPWGNESPNSNLINFERSVGTICLVGSYPEGASPYGVLDLAGNVREWVVDWYDEDYYEISPEENPLGPANGSVHICRGGGWADYSMGVRTTHRISFVCGYVKYYEEMYFYRHQFVVNDMGFRCAVSE